MNMFWLLQQTNETKFLFGPIAKHEVEKEPRLEVVISLQGSRKSVIARRI